jgi:hypothetical protein
VTVVVSVLGRILQTVTGSVDPSVSQVVEVEVQFELDEAVEEVEVRFE